jgi:hypothetical protein
MFAAIPSGIDRGDKQTGRARRVPIEVGSAVFPSAASPHLLKNESLNVVARFLPLHAGDGKPWRGCCLMTDSGTLRVISAGRQPK